MCLVEDLKKASKNTIDDDNDIDVGDCDSDGSTSAASENNALNEQIGGQLDCSSCSIVRKCINRTRKRSETIETILPNVVWLEHILPCLDRPAWNSLMEASKSIYMLATVSKLKADYHRTNTRTSTTSPSRTIAQPPWPTN